MTVPGCNYPSQPPSPSRAPRAAGEACARALADCRWRVVRSASHEPRRNPPSLQPRDRVRTASISWSRVEASSSKSAGSGRADETAAPSTRTARERTRTRERAISSVRSMKESQLWLKKLEKWPELRRCVAARATLFALPPRPGPCLGNPVSRRRRRGRCVETARASCESAKLVVKGRVSFSRLAREFRGGTRCDVIAARARVDRSCRARVCVFKRAVVRLPFARSALRLPHAGFRRCRRGSGCADLRLSVVRKRRMRPVHSCHGAAGVLPSVESNKIDAEPTPSRWAGHGESPAVLGALT